MHLKTPIEEAGKLFKMRAGLLEKLGILTVKDLLYHIPHRYEDFTTISKIGALQPGETMTVQGVVVEIKNTYARKRFTIQKAKVQDDTGTIGITWFNQPFIPRIMTVGDTVSLSGRVGEFIHKPTMENPDYEVVQTDGTTLHTGRLVPVYPETRGMTSKWLRRQIHNVLQDIGEIEEYLPKELLSENKLLDITTAIKNIHFPKSIEESLQAKHRLGFEELFFLQLTALHRKSQWKEIYKSNKFAIEKFEKR